MGKYMIIRKEEYERMKNSIDRLIEINSSFSTTIRESEKNISSKIEYLQYNNNVVLDKLQMTENARRTNAGKTGGLTKSLNKEKRKTEELLNTVNELEDTIKLQQLEIEKKDVQNKILKNTGKQKQMEDYKKLQELNQDIQKHKKVK